MQITVKELKQLIRESVKETINEGFFGNLFSKKENEKPEPKLTLEVLPTDIPRMRWYKETIKNLQDELGTRKPGDGSTANWGSDESRKYEEKRMTQREKLLKLKVEFEALHNLTIKVNKMLGKHPEMTAEELADKFIGDFNKELSKTKELKTMRNHGDVSRDDLIEDIEQIIEYNSDH
jgi:hypothetical protein